MQSTMLSTHPMIWIVGAGLATLVGAVFVLAVRGPSPRIIDLLSGFTAGIMLAASVFSLLVPAIELGSLAGVVIAILVGAGVVAVADALLPHLHLIVSHRRGESSQPIDQDSSLHTGVLVLIAMAIHNVPEGFAVGVAFAAGGPELGIPIALAIGIQNIPEGFVTGALMAPTIGARKAALVAGATGLVEPPAALLAYTVAANAASLLPIGLAFAAGAMLYVVIDELVPEQQSRGNERLATFGLLIGFVLMLALDTGIG